MGFEQIQNFLTSPELPDIVSYIFIFAILLIEYFLKKFVKKDNLLTLTKVDNKTKELKKMESELKDAKTQLDNDRAKWEKEKNAITKEISILKEAIKLSSGNSQELVSNGTANHIAKLIKDKENNNSEEDVNG